VNQATKSRKSPEYYVDGILQGNRVVLAQAITLVESTLPSDQDLASQVMGKIIEKSGNSIRVGITGSPGVGKSTFIEAFGKFLTGLGKKVAVLTVDPTSQKTKGSILGDKTRMPELATNPDAFIRPSSAGETLGGVANNTREAILLTEAAGFEIILIETVGVGQSEVAVRNMSDFFLLLMLPGSGDELQGIKKGIMEMADLIVITKADGENLPRAKRSQAEFQQAIHTLYENTGAWIPKVLTASSLLSTGLDEIYDSMTRFISTKMQSGDFSKNRALQDVAHMHDNFQQRLKDEIAGSSFLKDKFFEMEELVKRQSLTPGEAGKRLLNYFQKHIHAKNSEKSP
jgi:LAO/AO transport system kinase